MGMVMAWEARSALAVMRKMACAGLGGAFAGGGQRVSWVHMDDWLAALDFV
jgi:NAD dependent epimerase/dehydratase family enzyme